MPSSTCLRYDSIVNTYLIMHCCLRPSTSPQIALVVHSSSDYFAPVGFPAMLDLGLRVNRLARSMLPSRSVVLEVGRRRWRRGVGLFMYLLTERRNSLEQE